MYLAEVGFKKLRVRPENKNISQLHIDKRRYNLAQLINVKLVFGILKNDSYERQYFVT